MTEIAAAIEQEAAPLVVETPRDYVSALARTRLDLNPQKLQRAFESDVIGSPGQLASTLDKVEGREVVLNYLNPGGTHVRISSDREYPKDSKLGKVSTLLEAAARFKVLGQEETVPEQVKLAGWQIERGIKDFQKEAKAIASGRTFQGKKTEIAKKAVVLSLALTACSRINSVPIPTQEIFPIESTPTAFQPMEATPIPGAEETPTPNVIESSALSQAGLDVSVESVIPGYLATPQGERFVLAQSTWHQPSGEDAGLSLLMGVDAAGNITSVRGLAYNDYSAATSYDMFYGFTFDTATNSVNMSPYEIIRLQRETGAIEVYSEGGWGVLSGQEEIITEIGGILRGRAAPIVTTPEVPVVDEWLVSSDGRIASNPTEMYGGILEIVDDPEKTGYLHDRVLGILWGLNHLANNRAFLQRFPTEESFVSFAQSENPIVDMGIPVEHPGRSRINLDNGTLQYVQGIDISTIAIGIDNPSKQEMLTFSSASSPFYTYYGSGGELLVQPIELDGRTILSFTFRLDLLHAEGYEEWLLTPDRSPEEILTASVLLLNSGLWFFENLGRADSSSWWTDLDPPMFAGGNIQYSDSDLRTYYDIGLLPLAIRR